MTDPMRLSEQPAAWLMGFVGLVFIALSFGRQISTNLWKEPLTSGQMRFERLFYRVGGFVMFAYAIWQLFGSA